uniref:Peptidase A2 domain-containing protein n=1 Tax=Octopus bimaculoides TaxID=37653 RepID=A0A0L8FTP4_OCTBM
MGNDNQKKNEAYTTIQIQKKSGKKRINIDLKLKIDSGAQSDILPVNLYKKMFPEHMIQEDKVKEGILTPNDVILTAYGGIRIPQLGITTITGTHKGKIIKCSFYVTRIEGPAILGLDTCQKLNIVSINGEVKAAPSRIDRDMPIKNRPSITNKEELISMYPECFDDTVRCFEKCRYHITVDPNAKPIVHPPRRVPLELKEKLKAELDRMKKKDLLAMKK